MKSSILALALAAGLSVPAFAQQATPSDADHNAHHPAQAQAETTPPAGSSQNRMGAMPSPQGGMSGMPGNTMSQGTQRPGGMMSGMGQNMMMNCPMMQGMMGRGPGAMQVGAVEGDQGVASLAMNAVNERMHREMAIAYTGNVDADFVRNMIAHHQGAIDMARIEAAFGKDPKIRELAQAVIRAQEDEVAMMKSWLAKNAKQ